MSKHELDAEKEALLQGYVEGSLTPAESARLQVLLREDPLLVRVLMENLQMDGAIREITGETLPAAAPKANQSESQKIRSTHRFRTGRAIHGEDRWTPLIVAAVAAAVLIGLLFVFLPSTPSPDLVKPRRVQKRLDWERQLRESQERVRRAEEQLQQNDRQRESLAKPETVPTPDPVSAERKKQDLQRLEVERAKVEQELQEAIQKVNQAKEGIEQPEEGVIVEKTLPEPAGGSTRTAGVRVLPEGEVFLAAEAERTLMPGARELVSGQGVEVGSGTSRARILFPDRTFVEVAPGTKIGNIRSNPNSLHLLSGAIRAQVTKQRNGPMVISSPYGVATVLGTTLRIVVDPTASSMRLEVTEGKVRLLRLLDGKTVEVTTGHYAIAVAAGDMVARPLPIDDVFLFPSQASVSSGEWQSVTEDQAMSGFLLEAVQTSPKIKSSASALVNKQRPDHVAFTFQADAGREYALRIRGTGPGGVAVSIPGAIFKPFLPGSGAYPLPNFANAGLAWVGGEGAAPLTVRFTSPGPRTLKLIAAEAPVRVDSIWLSVIKSAVETQLDNRGETTVIFGPEGRELPNDTDYLLDTGKEFDVARGYGWVGPLPWSAIDPTKPKTDLHASMLVGGGKTKFCSWVFLLPNGKYSVTVSCGFYNQWEQGPHMVRVQDRPVVNLAMTKPGGFYENPQPVPVEVKDGRLVMVIGAHQSNMKPPDKSDDTLINFIKIRRVQ